MWLTVATLLVAATYLMRAFRWRVLLSASAETKLSDLFAVTNMGFSAIFLFGRAGEMVRPAVLPLRDPKVAPAASFMTIVVERICDLTASALLLAFSLLWFPAPARRSAEFAYLRGAGILMLSVIALGILALCSFRKYADAALRRLASWTTRRKFLPQRFQRLLLATLAQLESALRVLSGARQLAGVIFWTGAMWLITIIATVFLMRAFGLPFGLRETLLVMCWGMVGSLAPTPGGAAGAFHAATAGGLIFLGVARDKAVAVAIVTHLVIYAPALLFGLYYFLRSDLSFKRVRNFKSPHAAELATISPQVASS